MKKASEKLNKKFGKLVQIQELQDEDYPEIKQMMIRFAMGMLAQIESNFSKNIKSIQDPGEIRQILIVLQALIDYFSKKIGTGESIEISYDEIFWRLGQVDDLDSFLELIDS